MTNDPNPSPMGTSEWTPEQWEAFDKAETEREQSHDLFGRIVSENGWGVGGDVDAIHSEPDDNHGSINEQLDSSEVDDE
jgi:hypothetical protein